MKRLRDNPILAVDLTAMIDVIFLLLIFWMTVARISEARTAAHVEAPISSEGVAATEQDLLVLEVAAEGEVRVDGRTVAAGDLGSEIGGQVAGRGILLRADATVDVVRVQEVLAQVRAAGGRRVGLAVRGGGS